MINPIVRMHLRKHELTLIEKKKPSEWTEEDHKMLEMFSSLAVINEVADDA